MTNLMKHASFLFSLILLMSCAGTYNNVAPKNVRYVSNTVNSDVSFGYRYDVMQESRNKKYVKRETKKRIKVVAIKVMNNTEEPLVFGESLKLYAGNTVITPLEPVITASILKQPVVPYALYLLLTPLKIYSNTSVIDAGYVIGPGITLGNAIAATSANRKFLKELITYDLMNKTVQPGETVYGLFGLKNNNFEALSVKIER